MKKVLITRPNHNVPTQYFYYWSKKIIETAKLMEMDVLDLKVEMANKKAFDKAIKSNPAFVIMAGRGHFKKAKMADNEILIEQEDCGKMKSKTICAFLSKSAEGLGEKSVASGATAYIGHDDDFILCCAPQKRSDPLLDEMAGFFLDPLRALVEDVLRGKTANISTEMAKKALKENIKKAGNSKYDFIAPYLLWNMKHLKCIKKERIKLLLFILIFSMVFTNAISFCLDLATD